MKMKIEELKELSERWWYDEDDRQEINYVLPKLVSIVEFLIKEDMHCPACYDRITTSENDFEVCPINKLADQLLEFR